MELNTPVPNNFPYVSIDTRKKIEKYRWVFVGVILFVALSGSGAAMYWYEHRPSQAVARAKAADNKTYTNTQAVAKLLSSNDKFDQAASSWTAYAASTPNKNHKDAAYIDAAALYLSAGQYAQGVSMCKQAEAVSGITFDEADVAASAYMLLGNKPKAIHYYQEAVRLIPANISDRNSEIMSFNQAIKELQTPS